MVGFSKLHKAVDSGVLPAATGVPDDGGNDVVRLRKTGKLSDVFKILAVNQQSKEFNGLVETMRKQPKLMGTFRSLVDGAIGCENQEEDMWKRGIYKLQQLSAIGGSGS